MMICRNEADRYLKWTLPSLAAYVDEIRAIDDCSQDGTHTILAEHGALVQRNTRPMFYEHEGDARNQLLDWALEANPTHLLSIDADEIVADGSLLRETVETRRSRSGVWNLWMEEIWKADGDRLYERVDGKWGNRKVPLVYEVPYRMPRNWRIANRALASGREPWPVAKASIRAREEPVTSVFHLGWACKKDRRERYDRYVKHDSGQFHADQHLASIMWDDEQVKLKERRWPETLDAIRASLLLRINP